MPVTVIQQFEGPVAADQEENEVKALVMEKLRLIDVVPAQYATVELPQAIPSELQLGVLRDGRLRVVSPIRVKVTNDGGWFILEAIGLNEFGYGNNLSEATADLQRTIAELYFTLEADADRLGPDLKNTLENLRQAITRKNT